MNDNNSVTIQINGDDSGLERTLNEAEQHTRETASRTAQAAEQASQAASRTASAAASASEAMAQAGDAAGDASASISSAASALSGAGSAASSAAGQMSAAASAVNAVNTSAGSAAGALSDIASAAANASSAANSAGSAASSASSGFSESASGANAANSAAADYTAALNTLQSALDQCTNALAQYSVSADQASQTDIADDINSVSANSQNADSILQKLGSTIKGVFTVALIKQFADAVSDVGREFEYTLDKFSSIADTSVVPLEEFSDAVLKLSTETGVHAAELNEAAYQAVSAGVESANAVDMVGIAVKAAKAGFTDTTTAIDGLTTVLNAYKTANLDANDVANKFLITQNLGKTSFGELASVIGNIAPTANAAGVSIEEVLSAVASLTANGIATSQAVTGLKAALSNIVTPSSTAAKLADELGLEFNAAALESKGLTGFMEDLAEAAGGDTEVMAQLFGSVEALNSVLTLTSEGGSELFAKTMSEMASNTTALDTAYETMTGNLQSRLDVMKTAAENFGIDIYNSVSDSLQSLAGTAAGYIERLDHALTDEGFSGLAGELFQIAFDAINEFGQGIADALPGIVPEALNVVTTIAETITDNVDEVIGTAETILERLADALISDENLSYIVENVPAIMVRITDTLISSLAEVNRFVIQFTGRLIDSISFMLVNHDWRETAFNMMSKLCDALEEAQKGVYLFLDDTFNNGAMYGGDIGNVKLASEGFAGYLSYMREGIEQTADDIGAFSKWVAENYNDGIETIGDFFGKADSSVPNADNVTKWAESQRAAAESYAETCSKVSQSTETLTSSVEKSSANAAADLEDEGKTPEQILEDFKAWYTDLETQLAHGKIDDDTFRKKLSEKLNSDAAYWDSAYNSYWNKIKTSAKSSAGSTREAVSEEFKNWYAEQERLLSGGDISEETFYKNLGDKLSSSDEYKNSSAYNQYRNKVRSYAEKEGDRRAAEFRKAEKTLSEQLAEHRITEDQYWEKIGEMLDDPKYKGNTGLTSFREKFNKYNDDKGKRDAENFKTIKAGLENKRQTDGSYSEEDYYNELKELLYSDEYINNTLLNSERNAVDQWFAKADERKASEFKSAKEKLELRRQTSDISEEKYYTELRNMLGSDEYKDNTKLSSDREAVRKYFSEADKRQAEEVRKNIAELDSLKETTDMSDEKYYQKLGEIVFDEAVKHNQYLTSFQKKVNDYYDKQQANADKESLSAQKKAAKEELSQLKSDLAALGDAYSEELSKLTQAKKAFAGKLSENIFSSKEETVTDNRSGRSYKQRTDAVADIQKKIDARKKLRDALVSLVGKGIPDGLLSELAGMDPEEALRFASQLDGMSLEKLGGIFKQYEKYDELNREIADDIYGKKIADLNEKYSEELTGILGNVSGDAAKLGADMISEFVSGMDISSPKAMEQIEKFAGDVISKLGSAVSDAKLQDGKMTFSLVPEVPEVPEEAGENAADSIAEGITENSGAITDAVTEAVENASPVITAAVETRTSAAAAGASASAPAYSSPETGAVPSAQASVNVPDITIGNIKLVLRDGRLLADIVNSENKNIQIRGGRT